METFLIILSLCFVSLVFIGFLIVVAGSIHQALTSISKDEQPMIKALLLAIIALLLFGGGGG
ncbi:hypothetical protein [Desulfobacter sp.]|uniref:hypothetical protein n=1 Tax=Desulfobacter sp. TaxID=2294 RepID=UPI003D09A88E